VLTFSIAIDGLAQKKVNLPSRCRPGSALPPAKSSRKFYLPGRRP